MKMKGDYATGKPGKRQPRHSFEQLALAGVMMVACAGVSASPRTDGAQNLEFKGVLVEPPPCSINSDKPLTVDFGDKVGVRKIATGIYRQPVELSVKCDESSLAWQLLLSVTGNPVDFDTDNATVAVSPQEEIGIKLFLDGKPFALNKPIKVNSETLSTLEALLTQRDGSLPEEGTFTARVTLRADYQ